MKRTLTEQNDAECLKEDREEKERKRNKACLENRLYFTKVLGHPQRFSTHAKSLSEVLRIIQPSASIHFNFMVDLEWFMKQFPVNCATMPISIIVGEKNGTDVGDVKRQVARLKATNVVVGGARLPIMYGTHHTKLSIFDNDKDEIHVIISTANLLQNDWESKTQAFYHCRSKAEQCDRDPEKCDMFRDDLMEYLKNYSSSRDWQLIQYWHDRISNADFSEIEAVIIPSAPGYHCGMKRENYGHMRLRKVLSTKNINISHPTFIAQSSSIGSLGPKPDSWLTGQFLCSLAGGAIVPGSSLRLIYPCVEDVRNSVEGYMAGNSLPYTKSTASRQSYLPVMMHKWRSECWGRTRAMPHIKSYCLLNGREHRPEWLLITSANISKAAWGELQKNETQLGVRSYELGVLLFNEESRDMLPYDLPLTKYDSNDRPWLVDETYTDPDTYGLTWPPT
ncbi:hypothetical protein AB6A40_006076 [Gnathostoma spinigerum]|uniref:PLD phosphodiesterase domain-containing protein n=1 Tax=Gnathostoma spinigerum TaxID=75299 RepID=A0ABD6ERP8_9BILA